VPDHNVIAAVSETLQTALTGALSVLAPGPPTAELHDLQGNIPLNPARLTIFLFEVGEDPSARNRPHALSSSPPSLTLRKPPMALVLRYLLTPWSGDRLTDQRILARVLQVLYDDAILNGPQLQGVLAGTDQALKVTLAPLSLEERTRVWHAVQRPYRLSLSYEVRVVNLDPIQSEQLKPVAHRSLDYQEPEGSL
jgi:hypothetical protein